MGASGLYSSVTPVNEGIASDAMNGAAVALTATFAAGADEVGCLSICKDGELCKWNSHSNTKKCVFNSLCPWSQYAEIDSRKKLSNSSCDHHFFKLYSYI